MNNLADPTFYKSWDESKFKEILKEKVSDKNIIKVNPGIEKTNYCLSELPEEVVLKIKDNIVIDIGTGWGDSALIFNQYNPKLIDCFECNSYLYNVLSRIVAPYTNIHVSNLAMEEYGGGEVLVHWKDGYKSDSDVAWDKDYADALVAANAFKHLVYGASVSLVKINVGSSTMRVLKGGDGFFKRYRPDIFIIESSYDDETLEFVPAFMTKSLPDYTHKVVEPNKPFYREVGFREDYFNIFYKI